jgi:hypothetical protein
VGAYEHVPLTIETSPLIGMTGVSGGSCITCPAGASHWVLGADVAGGSTQTITVSALTLGEGITGVLPITVTAELAGSGLPPLTVRAQLAESATDSETLLALGKYFLDHGVGEVHFLRPEALAYAQTGDTLMPFAPETEALFHRCGQMVEANTGSGWVEIGPLGDHVAVEAEVGAGSSEDWQVRVTSTCGRHSEPEVRTIVADDVAPTAAVSPTQYLTGTFAFVRGNSTDAFPTTRAPEGVEVSINGGHFYPAYLSAASPSAAQADVSSAADWLFPVQFSNQDGEVIEVVARAVDEAGNVGATSAPVSITVDAVGPALTYGLDDGVVGGTATDGSGVASVEVSLDGGATYGLAALDAGSWSYDLPSSPCELELGFALIRARDMLGNSTHEAAGLCVLDQKVFLPLVLRSGTVGGR